MENNVQEADKNPAEKSPVEKLPKEEVIEVRAEAGTGIGPGTGIPQKKNL